MLRTILVAGVPAHDANDSEIAMRLGLPERKVLAENEDGGQFLVNSQHVSVHFLHSELDPELDLPAVLRIEYGRRERCHHTSHGGIFTVRVQVLSCLHFLQFSLSFSNTS